MKCYKITKWMLPITICLFLLIGCSSAAAIEETTLPTVTAANTIDTAANTTEIENTSINGEVEITVEEEGEEIERPANWTEETHSKDARPKLRRRLSR